MRRDVITSADGSVTLKLPNNGESFHSIAGAYEESQHIYIQNGLLRFFALQKEIPSTINIFETGFGTGLNCLLTMCNSDQFKECEFYYCSVDKYPLSKEEINALNHSAIISSSDDYKNIIDSRVIDDFSKKMHSAQWNERVDISANFVLEKVEADLVNFTSQTKFNIFFHDAFSMDTDPNLWSEQVFNKFADMAAPGAILVTYSSKGLVKNNLRNSGFSVKRFAGINGKRHNLSAQLLP